MANLNPSVPLCYSDRVTESLVCLLEKFCQMFDLVLLPLQLLLPFLIYHLQLYKPILQILFAQIMDQAVDQVLFAVALWSFSVWSFASAGQASLFQQFLDINELVRNFTIIIFYDLFRHNYIGHCQFEQEKKDVKIY